jgi:hypothetical protein
MNIKKNKTLVTIVVLFLAFGMVIAYVPLLFAPPEPEPVYQNYQKPEENLTEPPATASLTPSASDETEAPTATSTEPEEEVSLPDSFSGLEEESDSLDELLDGF